MSCRKERLDPLDNLAEYLALCRTQGKTVTYLQAADAIGVAAPQRNHKLTKLLESLMEQDYLADRPQRAALVVSRSGRGLPADGFFLKAQSLGLMPDLSADEFHRQCLQRLFDKPVAN